MVDVGWGSDLLSDCLIRGLFSEKRKDGVSYQADFMQWTKCKWCKQSDEE